MNIDREGIVRPKSLLVIVGFLSILFSTQLSRAQEASRFDVFGGYSYMRFDSRPLGFASDSNLNGWNAAVAGNITLKWGVFLDASGHYGQELTIYNFLIGPQYSFRRDKSRFFVHGFIGKAQNKVNVTTRINGDLESVGKAYGGGGGFDYDLKPRISIRVFQADYLHSDTYGLSQNDFRVSAGLVFHFGHIGHPRKL